MWAIALDGPQFKQEHSPLVDKPSRDMPVEYTLIMITDWKGSGFLVEIASRSLS